MSSTALVVATHGRFRKAADGTTTRVATCMINKWRAKINSKGIYNVRNPLEKKRKRGGERENGGSLHCLGKSL